MLNVKKVLLRINKREGATLRLTIEEIIAFH